VGRRSQKNCKKLIKFLDSRDSRLNCRNSGLERNLARNLDDSRARAEIELRAQRRLKWRPGRPQADGHRAGTARRGGELDDAHRSIVYAVEGVVSFKNELGLNAFTYHHYLELLNRRTEMPKASR
jgi:hypothetical protein